MKHFGTRTFTIVLGVILTVACLQAAHADGNSVSVGDPANPSGLSKALSDAYSQGAQFIVINKGTYSLSDNDHAALKLEGWKNVTISAYDVSLVLSNADPGHSLLHLDQCSNVTIEGAALSQNTVTAYQGRVVSVHRGAGGVVDCNWQPEDKYPVPSDASQSFDPTLIDSQTHRLTSVAANYQYAPMSSLGNGTFQFHFAGTKINCKVGDWLVGATGSSSPKAILTDCQNCTIEDVVMTRNGSSTLVEKGGGGNHYLHLEWAPGARPEGALQDPVVNSTGNGMDMTGAYPGPDIQDCNFDGVALGDCININGDPQPIAGTQSVPSDNGSRLGYRIVNCHIAGTAERGIRADRNNGYIIKNTIENCRQAISLGPENESSLYVENITIQGNTIRSNREVAIVVLGDRSLSNRNVVISDNAFLSNNGNEVILQGLSGVQLADNIFTGVQTLDRGMQKQSVVTVANCTNVTLTGNTVNNPWSYDPMLVNVGDNVTSLSNNDSDGMRKIKGPKISTVAGSY